MNLSVLSAIYGVSRAIERYGHLGGKVSYDTNQKNDTFPTSTVKFFCDFYFLSH